MKLLLSLALALVLIQPAPQGNSGTLSGRVTRPGSLEGIPGVQIILVGPSPVFQGGVPGYAPNASLTDAMRAQIDQLVASAPPGIAPEVVANAAQRMEAQLLGLPLPTPVAGAAGTSPQVVTTTDGEGRFTFQNLAPGRYQVRGQREGYFAVPLPGATGAPVMATATATVTAGQPTPPVEMPMLKGATVSGRVRDPNGQPVSNMQVIAQQWTYRNGKPTLVQVNTKPTDDRGEFRLFWLAPGDYLIGVNPPRPALNPRPTDAYARTWFPSVTDARSAPRIAVAEGAEVAAMDISIRPQSGGSISGQIVNTVVAATGQPGIPQPTLFVLSRDPNALADSLAPTYPNVFPNRNTGQFEIRGVPPGSYDLVATAPDSTGRQFPGRTAIEVGYGNLENVTIHIRAGVEVKARVVIDGTPVVAVALAGVVLAPVVGTTGIRVNLRSRESWAPPFDTAAASGMAADATGAFVFPNVPEANYNVEVVGIPLNAYVADIRAGGVSIYDTGLVVTTQPPGEIEVLVASQGAGVLEGSVSNAVRQPAEGMTVVLIPTASRRANPALYKTTRSGAQGIFRITGIPPGDYRLFAWESVPPTAYMNAEYIAPYENLGRSVKIAAGSKEQADVTVIPNERR